MNILIAILMALGYLSSPSSYNAEYEESHQHEIRQAQDIENSGHYRYSDSGVIVDNGNEP